MRNTHDTPTYHYEKDSKPKDRGLSAAEERLVQALAELVVADLMRYGDRS